MLQTRGVGTLRAASGVSGVWPSDTDAGQDANAAADAFPPHHDTPRKAHPSEMVTKRGGAQNAPTVHPLAQLEVGNTSPFLPPGQASRLWGFPFPSAS